MKKKMKTWFLSLVLSVVLVFSQAGTALAGYGDTGMTPYMYLFNLVLTSCGLYTKENTGMWLSAYRGYLASIGDSAMLAQLDSYKNLSWGDSVGGAESLFQSVKEWVAQSPNYLDNNQFLYELPSGCPASPASITGPDDYIVSSAPFSQCGEYTGSKTYVFSIAYMQQDGSVLYQNYYVSTTRLQNGYMLIGFPDLDNSVNVESWSDWVRVPLVLGHFGSTNFLPVEADIQTCVVSPDGSTSVTSGTGKNFPVPYGFLLSDAFPVDFLPSKAIASSYMKNSTTTNLIEDGKTFLYTYMESSYVRQVYKSALNDTFQLPVEPDSVLSNLESFYSDGIDWGNKDSFVSALSEAGLQVTLSEHPIVEPEPSEPEMEPSKPETQPNAPDMVADGITTGVSTVVKGAGDVVKGAVIPGLSVFGVGMLISHALKIWRRITGKL